MPKKNNPGCNCCAPPCDDYLLDNFDRADASTLGSDWSASSGTWSINTNECDPPATGLVLTTASADASTGHGASIDITGVSEGDVIRILLGASDANNYWCVEFDYASLISQTLRTIEVSGGSETVRDTDSGAFFTGFGPWRLCINYFSSGIIGGQLINTATSGPTSLLASTSYSDTSMSLPGLKSGIEVIGVDTTTRLDDFQFTKCRLVCLGDSLPDYYKVVIGGTITAGSTCDDCSAVAGTYLFEAASNESGGMTDFGVNYCLSSFSHPFAIDVVNPSKTPFSFCGTAHVRIQTGNNNFPAGECESYWKETVIGDPLTLECFANGRDITLGNPCFGTACDLSGATVTLERIYF